MDGQQLNSSGLKGSLPADEYISTWGFTYMNLLPQYFQMDGSSWKIPLFVATLGVIIPVGLVGNIITIIIMTCSPMKRHAYSVYLAALAASDLLNLGIRVIVYINLAAALSGYPGPYLQTMTGRTSCVVGSYLFVTVGVAGNWLVLTVTIDRFLAVIVPLAYRKVSTKSAAVKTSAAVVTVAVAFYAYMFIPGYIDHYIPGRGCLINVSFNKIHIIMTGVLGSHVPVGLIFVGNIAITIAITRQASFGASGADKKKQSAKRVTKLLLLVSTAFCLSFTPIGVVSVMRNLQLDLPDLDLVRDLGLITWDANYSMNFILYIMTSKEVRKILANCCAGKTPEKTIATGSTTIQ
ncbi:somatostatin receptor type 4-like [Tubulanus polymorphus]|uniref:somatostatin receptor type 4-like n=1 Tax=Tubulanus polymorphus TaxID=672921 RepID=UPI003DA29059